jgi:hypothetical protein
MGFLPYIADSKKKPCEQDRAKGEEKMGAIAHPEYSITVEQAQG